MTPTPPAPPTMSTIEKLGTIAKMLESVDLSTPGGRKRAMTTAAGVVGLLAVGPLFARFGLPPPPDAAYVAAGTLLAGFIVQSGFTKERADAAGAAAAGAVTTPGAARDGLNTPPPPVILLGLVGALLCASPAWAQPDDAGVAPRTREATCDELLDAGAPAKVALLPAGTVLVEPLTCMTDAKTCEVQRRIARAEGRVRDYEAQAKESEPWPTWTRWLALAVAVGVGAAGGYCLGEPGHCGIR